MHSCVHFLHSQAWLAGKTELFLVNTLLHIRDTLYSATGKATYALFTYFTVVEVISRIPLRLLTLTANIMQNIKQRLFVRLSVRLSCFNANALIIIR